MCDTVAVVPAGDRGPVWFAKNSDREPGESQAVELHPPRAARGATVTCTWVAIPEAAPTLGVVLSRPTWMWGAEMGVNERGVAIGNEAVFTRAPIEARGLTGMDLVRLTLERASSADDALERMTWLIGRYGQGGRCGLEDAGFRYHGAFLLADARGGWILETADRAWAASRATGVCAISNALSLEAEPDRVGPGTLERARRLGWDGRGPLSFRRVFGRRAMAALSGGDARRARTRSALDAGDGGAGVDPGRVIGALRDHGERAPGAGLRLEAPCAHAAPWPTMRAGQTTATLVARLTPEGPRVWATGTSSPCLSVLKPVDVDALHAAPPEGRALGGAPRAGGADPHSLFWRHERLHRAVMARDVEAARASFEEERRELEARALAGAPGGAEQAWEEHRARATDWAARVRAIGARPAPPLRRWFWTAQARRDGA